MKAIWNTFKAKIKITYYIIPNKNLFEFIREVEYKYSKEIKIMMVK